MVAFTAVGRFRHPDDPRSYRRDLIAELAQDLALRLLPALVGLPLPVVDAAGAPRDLGEALRLAPRATLAGQPGSGRRLALLQIAHRWAADERTNGAIPAPLSLARLDDERTFPALLLEPWTQPLDSALPPKPRRTAFSLLRTGAAPQGPAPWLLVLQGLEDLPPERQDAWRSALHDAPQRWPDLRLLVAVPRDEPDWPGYEPLSIASPTPELLSAWIDRLAPAEQRDGLLQALRPGGPLHSLGQRLFEVALLAWLAPRSRLPATRAGLYKRALEAVLDQLGLQAARAEAIGQLQLLAAYGESAPFDLPGFLERGPSGTQHFVYPQARRYLAARQLVEEGRYDLLQGLEQAEREELALLLATMLADPNALYAALWGAGQPRAGDVLVLGRCLGERATADSGWALRVAGALARLARAGAPQERGPARATLAGMLPALDASLTEVAGAGADFEPFLLRLIEALPDDLAAPRAGLLAYGGATSDGLAWKLADRLLALPAADQPPPSDPAALARWAYVQALRSPSSRQQLASTSITGAALDALAAAGAERRTRAARALLDDAALPVGAHVRALALLGDAEHPSAQAVIERAIHDTAADIRQSAIAALAGQDTQQAFSALAHAALDSAAPWDARLGAIQRLGEQRTPAAAVLLDRCARDQGLPLYARAQAAAALGRHSDGGAYLAAIVGDPACHDEVRATAARSLGAGRHVVALDQLLWLLDDPATPSAVAEAVCDALGALGAGHGQGAQVRDALLRAIEQAPADVALTLSAVRALGLLGDATAVEPLSALLGAEALARLQRGSYQQLLKQPVEACLNSPELPATLALRLASTCAEGATPADRPTTLAEFLISEADLLRAGAAASLAAIGGTEARSAILQVLVDGTSGGATDELIATLAEAEGDERAATVGYLLVAPEANPLTRWLAVRQLADHPAGEDVMRQLLAYDAVDPFTRGALAEALGQRGDLASTHLLLRIAEDRGADMHLRSQALVALGLLDQPATEPALMRLLGDQAEEEALRGLAAENLPRGLSDQGRRQLRDLLRRERVPPMIAVGVLRALRRMRDRESLLLLLRYTQEETIDVAQAAIAALAELGNDSMTPDLVRITQNPNADRAVRLEAVGALLRLGGAEFRPLLKTYLEQGALPLRLQALEHLIAAGGAKDELLALLADRSCPLLLRLRIVERLSDEARTADAWLPTLLAVLCDAEDDLHLRCLAADVVGRARYAPALAALIALAERPDTPASVRLRCINAIGAISGTDSWLALSRLAESNPRIPIVQYWAVQALHQIEATTES